MFSDESKFNLFGSDGCQWRWREPGQANDARYTNKTVKHGGGSVMVWGCITCHGVGWLHISMASWTGSHTLISSPNPSWTPLVTIIWTTTVYISNMTMIQSTHPSMQQAGLSLKTLMYCCGALIPPIWIWLRISGIILTEWYVLGTLCQPISTSCGLLCWRNGRKLIRTILTSCTRDYPTECTIYWRQRVGQHTTEFWWVFSSSSSYNTWMNVWFSPSFQK